MTNIHNLKTSVIYLHYCVIHTACSYEIQAVTGDLTNAESNSPLKIDLYGSHGNCTDIHMTLNNVRNK